MNEKERAANATLPALHKDNHFAQKIKVIEYLSEHTATMMMCSIATGVDRANICRFIRDFEDSNEGLERVRKGLCPITKHRATFFTIRKDGVE